VLIYLRLIRESILFAIHALRVNKLRTFLSLLGITIGIFTIILVFTVVDSLEKNVKSSIQSLGENVVFVQKWPWTFGSEYPWWKYMKRPLPTFQEMADLRERTQLAEAMIFQVYLSGKTLKYRGQSAENAGLMAISNEFDKVRAFELNAGRYFTDQEFDAGKPLIIIGANVKTTLFGETDALGKQVSALGRKLTVVGVFEKEGSSILESTTDDLVLLPVNFARNVMNLRKESMDPTIQVKARDGVSNDELMDEVRGHMRSIRRLRPMDEDNFALNESKLLSAGFAPIFAVIGVAGWIIGGFSILVGGFGIANIMFVSVRERTNQIGIQKSLGAKRYFILVQFLSEAIALCIIGGVIGLILVFLATLLGSSVMGFDLSLSFGNIITGLMISATIGVISGFIPAFTAAKLDPVEAIRSNG
jgi:putative ABC transport system permease protein